MGIGIKGGNDVRDRGREIEIEIEIEKGIEIDR